MKMTIELRKAAIFCFLILHLHSCLADVFEECNGIDGGGFVASSINCSAYIYCDNEDSMIGYCADGQYFNPDDIDCDYKENVYCRFDQLPEDPKNPEEPVKPEETTTLQSITTTTTTITTSTITTESIPTTSTFEFATNSPMIKDICPITDDPNQIVLIPNSQSCADYYLCYHGHAIQMHCANHLHFNTYTGKCDFPENVQCINDRPNANKCLPHVTDFFPHPEKCNYFYYCIKGFMTIQQCPFYYGWDIERRSCIQISQAKCYNDEKILRY